MQIPHVNPSCPCSPSEHQASEHPMITDSNNYSPVSCVLQPHCSPPNQPPADPDFDSCADLGPFLWVREVGLILHVRSPGGGADRYLYQPPPSSLLRFLPPSVGGDRVAAARGGVLRRGPPPLGPGPCPTRGILLNSRTFLTTTSTWGRGGGGSIIRTPGVCLVGCLWLRSFGGWGQLFLGPGHHKNLIPCCPLLRIRGYSTYISILCPHATLAPTIFPPIFPPV